MLTAEEARQITTETAAGIDDELEYISEKIRERAQLGFNYYLWRGIGTNWATRIQQHMYTRHDKWGKDAWRVQRLVDTLKQNGYTVKEYEHNGQFTDLGFTISW